MDAGISTIAMMKTFILSNVVPKIRKKLPDSAAVVLGKALVWLIYSAYDDTHNVVPQDFKTGIQMELNEVVLAGVNGVDTNLPNFNPICRVPIVVTGDQGCVYIDVMMLEKNKQQLVDQQVAFNHSCWQYNH